MERISKLVRRAVKRWAEERKGTDMPEQNTAGTAEHIETPAERVVEKEQTVQAVIGSLMVLLFKANRSFCKVPYGTVCLNRICYQPFSVPELVTETGKVPDRFNDSRKAHRLLAFSSVSPPG